MWTLSAFVQIQNVIFFAFFFKTQKQNLEFLGSISFFCKIFRSNRNEREATTDT